MAEIRRPEGLASRRGTAMLLLTAGDAEISGALADGVMAVRLPMADSLRPATRASSLGEGALTAEQVEVVKAEIDRQRVAELLKVAMHREPVDYARLAYDAEVQYGESLYAPGVLGKIGEKLLVGYALIVLAFEKLFESVGK